jgi:murein L,D-transpeptidase YcbB/YkuD
MFTRNYVALFCIVAMAAMACQQKGNNASKRHGRDSTHYSKQEYIEQSIDSNYVTRFLEADPTYKPYEEDIRNFYQKRDYHYAWINKEGLTEQAANFINLLKNGAPYGMKDSSLINIPLQQLYDTLVVEGKGLTPGDTAIPRIEMMLTSQFFNYANKVWGGLTNDSAKDLEWFIPRKKLDLTSLLDSMMNKKGNAFEADAPVNKQYTLLQGELKKLATLASSGKWDSIRITQKSYKKGDSAKAIAEIKLRLEALGDLKVTDSTSVFTAALDSAIRNFQHRMGLKEDGTIGKSMVDALNVPLESRIKQILVNMERLRWVPIEPGSDYILVNIPEFQMHVYDSGRLDWSCNVVVGKPGASTVIFTKDIKYIVFSPYWNVPPGILTKEVLPGIRRGGAGYLNRLNMEIVGANGKVVSPAVANQYSGRSFPYSVRQKPGKSNSLGKVKFLFPNEYNIYLHDTPSRYLFGETKRSFSHGCIRIAEPKKLAMWLLRRDSSWTEQKIDDAMNAGKEKYVTLKQKDQVPVFIGYFTAFVDSNGQMNFRDDVYGHDAKLAKLLFGEK